MSGNGQYGVPGKGSAVINKYGANLDIDAGPEDIWANGGLFPFLDAGIEMDIVFANAADTIAGTGAQKVELIYYLTDNTRVVQTFDSNGGTVPLAADVKIVTRGKVVQSGTGNKNAGKISIVDRATGLIVYQSIEVGKGQTQSAVQICEKGKKGVITKHSVTYAKAQNPLADANMQLILRLVDGTELIKHPAVISALKPDDTVRYDEGGIEIVEGEIIYWKCLLVGAADTPIEARFDMKIQDA